MTRNIKNMENINGARHQYHQQQTDGTTLRGLNSNVKKKIVLRGK